MNKTVEQDIQDAGFDAEKISQLEELKPEDLLTSVKSIATFAGDFLADDNTAEERLLALQAISRAKEKPAEAQRIDEAIMDMLVVHTNLNQDGIDDFTYRIAQMINRVAVRPVTPSDSN